MDDLLGSSTGLTFDTGIIMWSIISSVVVIVLYFVIKIVIRNYNRKKEQEEKNKNFDMLFNKYSDIFIDKLISKINNKQQ